MKKSLKQVTFLSPTAEVDDQAASEADPDKVALYI